MRYVIFFNDDERKTYFAVWHKVALDFEKFGYKRIKEVESLEECNNTIQQLNATI
jgi:hypothetical protein